MPKSIKIHPKNDEKSGLGKSNTKADPPDAKMEPKGRPMVLQGVPKPPLGIPKIQ